MNRTDLDPEVNKSMRRGPSEDFPLWDVQRIVDGISCPFSNRFGLRDVWAYVSHQCYGRFLCKVGIIYSIYI